MALMNVATATARTVTIDLKSLNHGDESIVDGWKFSDSDYLNINKSDVDTYILKGDRYCGVMLWETGKKVVFSENMNLMALHIGARDALTYSLTIQIPARVTVTITPDRSGPAVQIEKNVTLTVEGPGTLVATAKSSYCPGIGCDARISSNSYNYTCGTLIVKSGTVNATGGPFGAGIGGGGNSINSYIPGDAANAADGGTIIIQGGTVNAVGKNGAAGIGGGYSRKSKGGNGAILTISGGTVNATAEEGGAAIGGGASGASDASASRTMLGGQVGSYRQTGGTVTVQSVDGAGIGAASYTQSTVDNDRILEITGGRVTATVSGGGAGIGNGVWSSSDPEVSLLKRSDITPSTAEIVCNTNSGAGIGGGQNAMNPTVYISAKSVTATSKTGAGIGNGEGGTYRGYIYIYGGDIKAYSTDGQGIGMGKKSTSGTHTITLGDVDLTRGILRADIQSVNNFALSKFTCYNGTIKIKSDTKDPFVDPSYTTSSISGGSVYLPKPPATVNVDDVVLNVYQVKVRASGLSDNTDYLCSYIIKKQSVSYQKKTFYARPINGYFYFWLDESSEACNITIDGKPVYLGEVKADNNNLAPTVVENVTGGGRLCYSSLKGAFDASKEHDKLKMTYDYTLPASESAVSTKTISFDMNGYTLSAGGGASVKINSGLLTLSNAKAFSESTFHPVIAMQGGYLKKTEISGSGTLYLPGVTLKETGDASAIPVYWCNLTNGSFGAAAGFRQGDRDLVKDQRVFGDNYPYYFWLGKETDAGVFSMNATPGGGTKKYYYADNLATPAHNLTLSLTSYKALIENTSTGNPGYYKNLADAFAKAGDGETVKLIDNYTASSEMIRLPEGSKNMTLDLQSYSLSGDKTLDAGNHWLTVEGSGKLQGNTTLAGLVYTELDAGNLETIKMNGMQVYRTFVTNLPVQNSGKLTYRPASGQVVFSAGTKSGKAEACLWLPAGQQSVTLSDVLPTTTEQFAEASLSVAANHSNRVAASPLLNISGGTITVTPTASGSANVTYGSKSYVSSFSGTSASKRIGIYGSVDRDSGKDHRLLIASGSETVYLSLRGIRVQTASNNPALEVNAPADIELVGDNRLKGSYNGSTTSPAVQVKSGGSLTWQNCTDGNGRLYADGGAIGANASPAIQVDASATMAVSGGTLVARHGNGKAADAIEGGTQKILAGSVDALYKDGARPVNKSNNKVYKVSVTTGLTPDQPYTCSYKDCNPSPFMAMPDAAGKIYCWQPEQELSAEKTKVVLTHPVSFEKTEIEVVQVEQNDDNVRRSCFA